MFERRIQHAPAFEDRNRLQLDRASFGRRGRPPWLAGAANEISGRVVDANFEEGQTIDLHRSISRASQIISACIFQNRQNLIRITAIDVRWISDAEVFGGNGDEAGRGDAETRRRGERGRGDGGTRRRGERGRGDAETRRRGEKGRGDGGTRRRGERGRGDAETRRHGEIIGDRVC